MLAEVSPTTGVASLGIIMFPSFSTAGTLGEDSSLMIDNDGRFQMISVGCPDMEGYTSFA